MLRKIFSRVSVLALLVAAAVAGVLGYLTHNWFMALIIGLSILLAVLLVLIVLHYVRREREAGLEEGLAKPDDEERHAQSEADLSRLGALQSKFLEAVDGIKKDFRGRAGVYELPWVLFIGDEDAGKSTLLAECGLDLPAQYARRGFGPTDTLEFVRANELIALDTSSRYLTCKSEQDEREWQRLLALLRRHRPDCPLEAVVFAISMDRLLRSQPAELEELARALRLRLNEIRVRLRIDVPVYIAVTKAAQVAGFAALARLLRPEQLLQAFGWTNDQRRLPDPEARVQGACAELAERLEVMLPDLMLREPDVPRQRALFVLPSDLVTAGDKLAGLLGIAFKKDVYSESTPFLRGVYFTSARADSGLASPTLERLGAPAPRFAADGAGALFLHELVLEVIRGDHTLALREPSIGPLGRRAIQVAAAIGALWFVWAWGTSFWQNYEGSVLLADRAAAVLSKTAGASQISDAARRDRDRGADRAEPPALHRLSAAVARGRCGEARLLVGVREADRRADQGAGPRRPAARRRRGRERRDRARLRRRLAAERQGRRRARAAARELRAADRARVGLPGRLRRVLALAAERSRKDLVRIEQEQLAQASGRLLKLDVLETITARERGPFPPARRVDLGLPAAPSADEGIVYGVYTSAGRERLIAPLLGSIENSGSVSSTVVKTFKSSFAERFDELWKAYLLDGELKPAERLEIATSPYLALLAQVEENTKGDVPGRETTPPWLETFREVRRTLPLAEAAQALADGKNPLKPADAPWVQYKAAIDAVAVETETTGKNSALALQLAHEVAAGKPTEFNRALDMVDSIVPRTGDAGAAAKLRRVLAMPFLDAFSAVMRSAMAELDNIYRDDISKRFAGALSPAAVDELCAKGGALETFVDGEVKPFLRGTHPRPLLEDRAMPLNARFGSLLDTCAEIRIGGGAAGAGGAGGGGGPGEETFTLTGVPAAVEGAPGMLVTSRVFEVSCEGQTAQLRYSEGSATQQKFECKPGCELTLSIVVATNAGVQRDVGKSWGTCGEFLSQGKHADGEIREWLVNGPDGSTIHARYRVKVAEKPKGPAGKPLSIPGGLGG